MRLPIRALWYWPLVLASWTQPATAPLWADLDRWKAHRGEPLDGRWLLIDLLTRYPEFRSLYYYRLRSTTVPARVAAQLGVLLYPGERTLFLLTRDIGPGFFVLHGFATIVQAERIGPGCSVNQQVTIGTREPAGRTPVLEAGVRVTAGAKVLGDVTLGAGSTVGANAVVLHDVPPGATAVGVPARNRAAPGDPER